MFIEKSVIYITCYSFELSIISYYYFIIIIVYDFYGGYGGMYPGSMLVQTYPGGPIVAAVPVPVPVQPIDWYRGAAGGAGAAAAANGTAAAAAGEVAYYYALGYPAGGEIAAQTETTSSSRRNSLESYQVKYNLHKNIT